MFLAPPRSRSSAGVRRLCPPSYSSTPPNRFYTISLYSINLHSIIPDHCQKQIADSYCSLQLQLLLSFQFYTATRTCCKPQCSPPSLQFGIACRLPSLRPLALVHPTAATHVSTRDRQPLLVRARSDFLSVIREIQRESNLVPSDNTRSQHSR